jgi:glycosyltransferase involved in cell wall biosynthesis
VEKKLSDLAHLDKTLDDATSRLQVLTVMDWITRVKLDREPLISVVLPTRDRRPRLERAIKSVILQTYSNWELLIVDDASVDDTAQYLRELDSPKISFFSGEGRGVCAARNIGLGNAHGSLIAYLDDDNVMHPAWLKSVVWAFEQHPDKSTLYGGFVVDDSARILRPDGGDLPRFYFFPYDHKAVALNNIADMGSIAHRAGLSEARFDETLREMGDWDLFLRLTREQEPLALPAVACYYTTDAPNRLSGGPTHDTDLVTVRSKNAR